MNIDFLNPNYKKNIAINGLGRIGRLCLRAIIEQGSFNIVAINSPADNETLAHLIKYDSVHGVWNYDINHHNEYLIIQGNKIKTFHEKDLKNINWHKLDVKLVFECSGKVKASSHINSGAAKVLVSAPYEDADITVVMGVNHDQLNQNHRIISIGSCTTNALAPIVKILNDNLGIISGYVTTIHSYTADQNLVDNAHKDLRRARSANLSMIPTKTGAAKNIKAVIPEMENKLTGSAIRVPTANVSLIDLTCLVDKKTSITEINNFVAFSALTNKVLGIAKAPLVSIDFNHSIYSSIFDPFETNVLNNNFIRVLAWYDNEWAFVHRMIDVAKIITYSQN